MGTGKEMTMAKKIGMAREKKAVKEAAGSGGDYISLALYAFAGLGVEMLYAYLLEPLLYGGTIGMQDFSSWSNGQRVLHWTITCITWGIIGYLLMRSSREKYGFDLLGQRSKMRAWQWCGVALCVAAAAANSYRAWDGFKVLKEFAGKGALLFTFQYIYYAFETVLFMLIIVFAQKAFEVWFKNSRIPYGGIVCGLTWGLVHAVTKGNLLMGLEGLLVGFLLGAAYLFAGRDIRKTYLILLFMFVW